MTDTPPPQDEAVSTDTEETIRPDQVTGPDGQVYVTPDETDFNPQARTIEDIVQEPDYIERAPATAYSWDQLTAMSTQLARSPLLPKDYRNRPENVMAMAIMAQELGWGVMTAMRFVHVIEGKPTVSPEGMLALVRRAGHSVTGEADSRAAQLRGVRKDNGDELWVRFTIEDARTAGLLGKDNWKRYPDAMLWARALGMLCRRLFSDVLLGAGYTPEELGAVTDEVGNPIIVDANTLKDQGRGTDWAALGWRDEQHMNEHRLESKVIMDALPKAARDEVRRLAGPMPDPADYSLGVWNRRHSILLDVARKAGLIGDDDKLLPQFEAGAAAEESDPEAPSEEPSVDAEAQGDDEAQFDVCMYCMQEFPIEEWQGHVENCEEKDTPELPAAGAYDEGGYGS